MNPPETSCVIPYDMTNGITQPCSIWDLKGEWNYIWPGNTQIITLLKRSHSSWRSNRLLEMAARREGSWRGAVGRKWEISRVSVVSTMLRHFPFHSYFSCYQSSLKNNCRLFLDYLGLFVIINLTWPVRNIMPIYYIVWITCKARVKVAG